MDTILLSQELTVVAIVVLYALVVGVGFGLIALFLNRTSIGRRLDAWTERIMGGDSK